MIQSMIAILDLGSTQSAQIAREIRALGVYSEIHPHDIAPEALKALPGIAGIILNGGENRVVDGAPVNVDPAIYDLGLPVLSVDYACNGHPADLPAWPENVRETLDAFIEGLNIERNWNMDNFIADQVELLKKQIGSRKVLLALSGGVDSSVVAALLLKAVGDQLTCVHVNHGLLRKGEPEQVVRVFKEEMGANLIYVDAVDRFLDKLAGVSDPEQKRKIIGAEFIRVFEEEARKLEGIELLGQGTIYPDIIESGTKTMKAVKAHHNVGGLPEDLKFELVEPLKYLFKDEVRAVGKALGLPDSMVYRQPFPGPGLGVRCLGAITRERLEIVHKRLGGGSGGCHQRCSLLSALCQYSQFLAGALCRIQRFHHLSDSAVYGILCCRGVDIQKKDLVETADSGSGSGNKPALYHTVYQGWLSP